MFFTSSFVGSASPSGKYFKREHFLFNFCVSWIPLAFHFIFTIFLCVIPLCAAVAAAVVFIKNAPRMFTQRRYHYVT